MFARAALVGLVLALVAVTPAAAQPLPPSSVAAREHFFGPGNVDGQGHLRRDRVILSWFSVASVAAAIDGHVVLLDTYIHKGQSTPGYVPTTTEELVALRPEAIFIGHGHFDHANTAGPIAARTGAHVFGTAEHCAQTREQASAPIHCSALIAGGAPPGTSSRELAPLGRGVGLKVLKHVHSGAEPPDGENHESSLGSGPLPDPGLILLHPPGPGVLDGLNPSGDEGGTLLYRFRVGDFTLAWHDSSGTLREEAPGVFADLRRLRPVDVEVGATLGFNDPTNGMRDPVDYLAALRPRLFFPTHHDFIAEYGASKNLEGVFRRELARRGPVPTQVHWLHDPRDYLRPQLMTFDVGSARFADREGCLARRAPVGPRNIGRVRIGLGRRGLRRLPGVVRSGRRAVRFCVKGGRGSVRAVLAAGRVRLVTSTAPGHGNRRVRPGARTARLRAAYPHRRRVARGVMRISPRSLRIVGVRRGRVRFVGVGSPRALRRLSR